MLVIVQVKRDVIIESGTVFVLSDTELRVMGKNNQRIPCDVLTTQDQISTTPPATPRKKPSAKQQSTKGAIKFPEKGVSGAILRILEKKPTPLSFAQLQEALPDANPSTLSARLSVMSAQGLIKKIHNGTSPFTYTTL